MKQFIQILFAAWMLLSTVSCQEGDDTGCITYFDYYLSNQSGHTIAIVHKPRCLQLPDSLVLQHGEKFLMNYSQTVSNYEDIDIEWSSCFETQAIYYDNRYRLNLTDLPSERQFQHITNYPYSHTISQYFTFTEEDYAYAVEHGEDLGAEQ